MRRNAKLCLCLLSACLLAACLLAACSASADERMGEAQGYGGTLKVRVTVDGEKLTRVEVTEHHETQGVGTRAIDALPEAMASAGTWDVDTVSGATVTSNAVKNAVRMALGEETLQASPVTSQQPDATQQPVTFMPDNALSGVGMVATGRIGPGTDDTGAQVYSFNVVFASGVFDQSGKVLSLNIDQLEVATPNYASASMPRFSGFPGQDEISDDAFLEEVSSWTTKRQRGDEYKLTTGTWEQQMDAYQQLFIGKTVDEIEGWYAKLCSDETGRPLQESTDSEADQTKYSALSDSEKSQLTDITSSATISLRDPHGDILTAIRRAWEDARGSAP